VYLGPRNRMSTEDHNIIPEETLDSFHFVCEVISPLLAPDLLVLGVCKAHFLSYAIKSDGSAITVPVSAMQQPWNIDDRLPLRQYSVGCLRSPVQFGNVGEQCLPVCWLWFGETN